MTVVEELRAFPLFHDMPLDQLEVVASEVSRVSFQAGESVFRAGEYGDAMGMLLKGKLNVHVDNAGLDVTVGSFQGALLGAMAVALLVRTAPFRTPPDVET